MSSTDKYKYTRVSTLIRHLTDYSNISKKILANKAEVGKFIHKQVQDILATYLGSNIAEISKELMEQKLYEIEKSPLDTFSTFMYLKGFYHLCREKTILTSNHISIEKRYYDNEYMISGQVDLLTERDNKVLLIDWKTTAMYNETANSVQMYLYKMLAEQSEGITVDECYIIQLLNCASYCVHKIDFNKYEEIAIDILNRHALSL